MSVSNSEMIKENEEEQEAEDSSKNDSNWAAFDEVVEENVRAEPSATDSVTISVGGARCVFRIFGFAI